MADTTIEEQISIGIQDGFSTALKSMQTQLTAILAPLGEVSVKLDDISKLNLSKTINQLSKMKGSVVDISNAAGRVQFKKDANVSKSAMNKAIKSNSDFMDVQTQLGLKEISNYERLIDIRLKELEAKVTSTNAYAEDVAKRVSKRSRERNLAADTRNKNASANFKNAKAEALLNSDQARFAGGWRGGITSILSHYGTTMRHRPVLGILERYGNRLGQNKEGWVGRHFGKLNEGENKGWNVNNWFGGLMAKGTVKGLGINAGGLALGGFATVLAGAVTAIEKFRDATLSAYGEMQKLSISMEVVYGSKSESNAAFGQLQQYATHSPFSVSETTEMAILLKQSGVYASDLQKTLEMIGDVSSGNEEKMKRIANNYAQIQAIGHANMLDMRQFAYAGLPIYEEVAKTMNTSQQALRSMISNGEVTAEIMEETFKRMTSEGGMFFKSVQKGSKAYSARQINLQDIQNISKANWGEWLWNNGSGIAGNWLNFKEGFAEAFGDIGKRLSVNQNYENALNSDAYISSLKRAYAEALAENNEPQAEMLKKSILEARGAGYGEDTIIAGYREKLFKDMGWDKKTFIDEREMKALKNQLDLLIRNNAEIPTENMRGYGGYIIPYKDKIMDTLISQTMENPAGVNRAFSWSNPVAQSQASATAKVIEGSFSRSDLYNALMKFSDELTSSGERVAQALAVMQSEIATFAKTAADSTNKIARASSSLTSRVTEYKQLHDQTPEAKAEVERKRFAQYQKDKRDIEYFNKIFNPQTDTFTRDEDLRKRMDRKTLEKVYGSGWLSASPLTWNNAMFDSGTSEERNKNTEFLLTKLDEAIYQFEILGNLNKEEEKANKEIVNLRKNLKDWIGKGDLGKVQKSLFAIDTASYNVSGVAGNILQSIFQDFDAPKEIAKYVSTMQGDAYISLWKRIMGGATGWDPERIRGTAVSFLDTYQTAQSRNIVGGAIKGMVEAGYSMQRIADSFEYENRTNKLENTRQIDWTKTLEKVYGGGLFGGNTKTQAKISTRLAESTKAAIAVYDTLKEKAFTTAEDWGNISKHFSNDDEVFLANAFAGGLKAYTKGESGTEFNLAEEDGKYVLNDKALEDTGLNGLTIEEAKKAVENNSLVNEELKTTILNLKTTTENVTSALDRYQEQLKLTSVKLESISILSNAGDKARKESVNSTIEAISGSFRLQEALGLSNSEQQRIMPAINDVLKNIAEVNLSGKYKSYDEYAADMDKQGKAAVSKETFDIASHFSEYLNNDEYNEALGLAILYLKDICDNTKDLNDDLGTAERIERRADYNKLAEEKVRNLNAPSYEGLLGDYGYMKTFRYSDGTVNSNSLTQQAFMNRNGMGDMDYNKFINSDEIQDYMGENGLSEKKLRLKIDEAYFQKSIANISQSLHDMWDNVPAQMISETFSSWGEALAKSEDKSEHIKENLKAMGAGLLSNTGQMLTQAGLALAISSIGNTPMVLQGLAIAAAGGGMSFLGGMLSAKEEDNDTDDEYKRLNQIKDDLSDLLKQAREDAIYYENTVRHRKALSTNGSISVNDAIITPSGQVISTHPDDYLIATKTPQTLGRSGGAPTINFSVVDKSTGIKVTKQKSNYNEDTNSIDFEAVIESKVQEIIATSKGDSAFNARQMRLNGNSYVG